MSAFDEKQISRRQALQGIGGVLLVAGFGGGLIGCGDSGDSSGTNVTAWIYRPEYRASIDKILDAFTKAHPDISVDMSYKPTGQYPTILKTALVGGSGPDAIATNGASGVWGDTGADGGYILPLDGKYDVDALQPTVRDAVTYKGHVYAAPVQTFRIGIYYQKPLFAKHGITPPRTWAELTAIGQKLKDAGVAAWAFPAQDMIIPTFFYHLAVNSILGDEGVTALASGKVKLTDPNLVTAAQLLKDTAQFCNPGFQAVAYAEGKALFAQARTAMTIGGSSDYAGYEEVNPKLDVGFFGFPSPDGARPPVALNGLSMAYAVNKKAANRAATITFVSWLTSKEAQRIVLQELGLPSIKGVEPTGSDARDVVLRQILSVADSPSWLDFPSTGGIFTDVEKSGSGIFTGKLTPQQFAALAQKSIKVTPAG